MSAVRRSASALEFQELSLEHEKLLAAQERIALDAIRSIEDSAVSAVPGRVDVFKESLRREFRHMVERFVSRTSIATLPFKLKAFFRDEAQPVLLARMNALVSETVQDFQKKVEKEVEKTIRVGVPRIERLRAGSGATSRVLQEYAKVIAPMLGGVAAATAIPFAAITTTLFIFTTVSWPIAIGVSAHAC